ncbi:DUF2934 domain-containing protein [Rhizobium puerariae]|uniref:DUF2934 domain-containing protein n=1 Tax=Rhizobium puerariae TaxID=1585791 RepID=A0ABV6AH83_9HYPH
MSDSEEEWIRKRAYALWEEEGYPTGKDREHWERAKLEHATLGPTASKATPPSRSRKTAAAVKPPKAAKEAAPKAPKTAAKTAASKPASTKAAPAKSEPAKSEPAKTASRAPAAIPATVAPARKRSGTKKVPAGE